MAELLAHYFFLLVIPGPAKPEPGIHVVSLGREELDSGFAPAERPGITSLGASCNG